MFFHEITFVLRSQVHTPVYRKFELMTFSNSLFQYLDAVRIRQTYERFFQYTLQTFNQAFVKHIVQELHVVSTVIQSPLHTEFDKLFRQIHIVRNIVERYFRFHHPELSQMAWSIGVFCTKCRAKSINSAQCRSSKFTFQLSGNRQTGLLTKEVVIINDGTDFIFLQIIEVLRRYLKHLSGTFTVRCRNDRCMEINEAFLMKESMDSYRHVMTDAEHRTESIRTGTQVSNLTQEFQRMTFLLQRICIITSTQHFNLTSLNLSLLTGAY